ncbi:MAG: CHAD domain-containing protein, partial [Candidatus Promineifilaceae bacterium]
MYQIQVNENSSTALKQIIKEEIDGAVTLLTDSADMKDEAVHETRKNIKRIRAGLRLVREEIGEEVFGRHNEFFRNIGRQLAPLRDSAVMVEMLDLVQARYEPPPGTADSFEILRQRLVERSEAISHQFFQESQVISNLVE